jgi:flagellar hook-associated protein 2
MANIDYINALGAGASFDTKSIVESLVQAERAGAEAQIQRKLATAEAKISGLGAATSILNILKAGAEKLNDAKDFNTLSFSNSQTNAFSASVSLDASAGTNSINITSVAKEQRSISGGFDSKTTSINGSGATTISISVGGGATQTLTVNDATLESVRDSINSANLGIQAEILDTGAETDNFRLQLVGESGASKDFTISSNASALSFSELQVASNASLTVNGVDFTRSSNTITDVIQGVTLNLNSVTTGTATLAVNRDTSEAKQNIKDFVAVYNEAQLEFKKLTDSETDGPLRGDTIFRGLLRNLNSIVLNQSSTPGSAINSMSSMGISVDKTGQLLFDEQKLDAALSKNFEDVIKIFSADTDNQTRFSSDAAGIAGDIKTLIENATASDGYLTTAEQSLQSRTSDYNEDLEELNERMATIEERYNRQFLAMQTIIEEMNSTKESLISSLENLPFTRKD